MKKFALLAMLICAGIVGCAEKKPAAKTSTETPAAEKTSEAAPAQPTS
jgi:hypothetical protein